jgi:flagellar biogenesis protein FliO
MRKLLILLGAATGPLAMGGEGFLGTKASPVAGPMTADTGGAGFMPFLQMMIALVIVLALLKFVMPKMVTKLNKKLVTKLGSGIRIEESAAFAGGTLYIVQAKSKTLLLSVTSSGVACLSDLTEAQPQPDLPTFQEIVNKEMAGPLQPLAVVDATAIEDATRAREDAHAALERLRRLAG